MECFTLHTSVKVGQTKVWIKKVREDLMFHYNELSIISLRSQQHGELMGAALHSCCQRDDTDAAGEQWGKKSWLLSFFYCFLQQHRGQVVVNLNACRPTLSFSEQPRHFSPAEWLLTAGVSWLLSQRQTATSWRPNTGPLRLRGKAHTNTNTSHGATHWKTT